MAGAGLKFLAFAAALSVLAACGQAADETGEGAPLTLPAARSADAADAAITLVPPGYERAADGLSYLFHVAGDIFGTIDPIDNEVLFINPDGEQLGVARLPDGFDVRDIDIGQEIVLRGDRSAVRIPRSGAIPAELKSAPLPRLNTRSARKGKALDLSYRSARGSGTLSVEPVGAGPVLAVTFLGFDKAGRPYAYWEEGSGRDIDSWVGRFAPGGRASAAGKLDFSEFGGIPAVPVAVMPAGTVLMIHPTGEAIELIELTLAEGKAGAAGEKKVGAPRVNVLDVGAAPAEAAADWRNQPEVRALRGRTVHDPEFAKAALARARKYLEAKWTLQPGNFRQSGIEHNCEPQQGLYWSRPTRLTEARVGQAVTAIPYKWGGFDSVEQFQQRLSGARPALAGNVCTCRESKYNGCSVPRAAGVDCSGFVSRSWGLPAHKGTSQLAGIATELPSLADLKPGDILNRPGSHVRLFVGFEPGPEMRLRTLESAVSCGGVCERVYTPAQLIHYRPMRLRRA